MATPERPREIVLLGAASSAGAHHAGQERAPDALRAAGLVERMRAAGLAVHDRGDIVHDLFRVDRENPSARNLAAAVRAASSVADAVEQVASTGAVPLVLGGDCTLTLGVLAGLQRVFADAGLVYVDGDADLSVPGIGTGVLDATGVAHLLGLADTALLDLFATRPPIADERLALLGYNEADPETFRESVLTSRPNLFHRPDAAVRADPVGCARAALGTVGESASRLLVHFDVDAVDSADLPLGNFPHYGTGVPLAAAGDVLSVLFAAPRLAAAVLTEVNPSYDPAGDSVERYVATVVGALAAGVGLPD